MRIKRFVHQINRFRFFDIPISCEVLIDRRLKNSWKSREMNVLRHSIDALDTLALSLLLLSSFIVWIVAMSKSINMKIIYLLMTEQLFLNIWHPIIIQYINHIKWWHIYDWYSIWSFSSIQPLFGTRLNIQWYISIFPISEICWFDNFICFQHHKSQTMVVII